jgi:hypothetical protein
MNADRRGFRFPSHVIKRQYEHFLESLRRLARYLTTGQFIIGTRALGVDQEVSSGSSPAPPLLTQQGVTEPLVTKNVLRTWFKKICKLRGEISAVIYKTSLPLSEVSEYIQVVQRKSYFARILCFAHR